MVHRLVPLCLLACISLLLCSCQPVAGALYPTLTPYPTYTPQRAATPSLDCAGLLVFLDAVKAPTDDLDSYRERWGRWMHRLNTESLAKEAILDRLREFSDDLGDIQRAIYDVTPPRGARKAADLLWQTLQQQQRAVAYLQGYNSTGTERDRAEGNAALATADRLYREYHYEVRDLWEECFGPLRTATP